MDFCEAQLMEGDCLWLLHFLAIGIFSSTTARVVLISALLVQLAVYAFEIFMFSIHPEYFMKYAPFLFSRAYGVAAGFAILWKRKFLANIWDDFELWSIASVGDDFHARAKRIIQQSNVFACVILLLGFLMGAVFFLPNAADFDYNLIMYLLREWFPGFSCVLVFILKITLVPVYCSMIVHPLLMFYATQHIWIQGSMFFEKIESITDDIGALVVEEKLIHDESFQFEIYRRLCFIVSRHIQMIKLSQKAVNGMVTPLFVVLGLMSFILAISIILIVYELNLGAYENTWNSEFMLVILCLLTIALSSQMAVSGQAVENASEEIFYSVTKIKWHVFNKSNRMTTIVILQNSLKPLQLKFSTNLAINFNMGLRMVRGLYSMASLILSMQY